MSNNSQLGRGAKLEVKTALLCTDFGLELFKRKAGKQAGRILAGIPVFKKGRNAGKYKGCIMWIKCIAGGYDYQFSRYGVVRGGSFDYRVSAESYIQFEHCEYELDFDRLRAGVMKRILILQVELAAKMNELFDKKALLIKLGESDEKTHSRRLDFLKMLEDNVADLDLRTAKPLRELEEELIKLEF